MKSSAVRQEKKKSEEAKGEKKTMAAEWNVQENRWIRTVNIGKSKVKKGVFYPINALESRYL